MQNRGHPQIWYEINTWVWLHDLSRRYGRGITLGNVPEAEWEALAELGLEAVWFMGVWERSPAGLGIALENKALLSEFRRALPDFKPEDALGSAYCVRRYRVDDRLGGPQGLAQAREQLARRGIGLLLDFVPNHVARDHPWVVEHPDYFIQGRTEDLRSRPGEFFPVKDWIIACGRDPYFPPWQDVAQVNAFHPGLRRAAQDTLIEIAGQCDGVRCDMAMLLINPVFGHTWGRRAGQEPALDYWPEVIQGVRKHFPDFLFVAEVYWDLELELQQQGFDFCYDKRLYDRLEQGPAEGIGRHLRMDPACQQKLVRFIENHDEPRAAAVFPWPKHRAAAVISTTLPGATLFYEGQFEGRKIRPPVFLTRRPRETIDQEALLFYRRLLEALQLPAIREGEWALCERAGWPDNQSFLNLLAWCRRREGARVLIVVNFSDQPSQGRVRLPWTDPAGGTRRLTDFFTGEVFEREGRELEDPGLYVDLEAWGFHFFFFR